MDSNIQHLQNINSYSEYVKNYLDTSLQSIANLGQKKPYNNSLSYSSFSFSDVINEYSGDNMFVQLKKVNNKMNISLYNKETNNDTIEYPNNLELIVNILNNSNINKNQELINDFFKNYEIYDHFINKNGDDLTYIIKFSLDKVEKKSNIPVDLLYVKYKKSVIEHIIYITSYNNSLYSKFLLTQNSDYIKYNSFVLYKLDINNQQNYDLKILLFSDKEINNIIKSYTTIENTELKFIDLYNCDVDTNGLEYNFSIFNDKNVNYDNLVLFNENFSLNNSFISILLAYENNEDYNILGDDFKDAIKLNNYNYSDLESKLYNSKLNTYIDSSDLFNSINDIINVIQLNYEQLLENIYNLKYTEKQVVFIQIINLIYNSLKNENVSNNVKDRILVPLNYKFTYICDNNDNSHIYFSNYINIISSNLNNLVNDELTSRNIYYDNPNVNNNLSVWNFNIIYDDNYDLIDNILVNKIYTMPYINSLYNWVVNDIDTNISVLNTIDNSIKLFVIYADNTTQNVLNVNDKKFKYELSDDILISRKYFSEYNNIDISFNTYIPEINDSTKNYFNNSLLYIITNKEMIKEDDNEHKYYYEDYCMDYIYTLWYYDESKGKFKYIKDFNDEYYFFDPFNSNNMLSYISNLKNNSILSLRVNIPNVVTQSSESYKNKWIIQRNKTKEFYKNSNNIDNYDNNLNLSFEVLSKYVNDIESINYNNFAKYIDDLNDIKTTTALYPKYSTENTIVTKDKYEVYIEDVIKDVNVLGINIYINNDQVVSSEYVSKDNISTRVVELFKTEESIVVEKVNINNIIGNYNENIPNEDIPTIDNKEMLLRNTNLINRLNILKFANTDGVYNGYIGVENVDTNQNNDNSLVIGTSNVNINIGNDTLLSVNQQNKFKKFNNLKTIGFDNVYINSNNKIYSNKHILDNAYDNYLCTSIIPIGALDQTKFRLSQNNIDNIIKYHVDSISHLNNLDSSIIFVTFESENSDNLFTCIHLNNLINKIFDEDITSISNNYTIVSDNLIINILSNNNNSYKFMLINKTFNYNDISSELVINKKLNITFDKSNKIFYIDFDDSLFNNKFSNLIIDNNTDSIIRTMKNSSSNNIIINNSYSSN